MLTSLLTEEVPRAQVGEFDLVLQLVNKAQGIRELYKYRRDLLLATALALCGLATQAFKQGQVRCTYPIHALRAPMVGASDTL